MLSSPANAPLALGVATSSCCISQHNTEKYPTLPSTAAGKYKPHRPKGDQLFQVQQKTTGLLDEFLSQECSTAQSETWSPSPGPHLLYA